MLFAKDRPALLVGTSTCQETKGELRRLWAQYALATERILPMGRDAVVSTFNVSGISAAPSRGSLKDAASVVSKVAAQAG